MLPSGLARDAERDVPLSSLDGGAIGGLGDCKIAPRSRDTRWLTGRKADESSELVSVLAGGLARPLEGRSNDARECVRVGLTPGDPRGFVKLGAR